jgi:hypothetical protein
MGIWVAAVTPELVRTKAERGTWMVSKVGGGVRSGSEARRDGVEEDDGDRGRRCWYRSDLQDVSGAPEQPIMTIT